GSGAALLLTRVIIVLCLMGGCGRAWYRRDAYRETYDTTQEHITDPRWEAPYLSVNPNPASRLYDPFDPDFPPMPPDDPAASQYMVRANGMPGYRHWHKYGDAPFIEDAEWGKLVVLDWESVLGLSWQRVGDLA